MVREIRLEAEKIFKVKAKLNSIIDISERVVLQVKSKTTSPVKYRLLLYTNLVRTPRTTTRKRSPGTRRTPEATPRMTITYTEKEKEERKVETKQTN